MQAEAESRSIGLLARRAANIVGKPWGLNFFPRAFAPATLDDVDGNRRDAVFDSIYRHNSWASSESRSGVGSEARFAGAYLHRLRTCMAALGVRRLFDAPCGDLNWSLELARDPAIDYSGGDISRELIDDLQSRFPDLDLRTFDICEDPFPSADVWHCRDCLFHLPFRDIRAALENFVQSGIPHALLTTHKARLHRNLDVDAGGFRYLDLERAPFRLPPASCYLRDYRFGRDFPRFVGLWTREDIAGALSRWDDLSR